MLTVFQYNPAPAQYDPTANQYNPTANQYNPTADQYNPNTNQYNSAPDQYNSVTTQYNPFQPWETSNNPFDSHPVSLHLNSSHTVLIQNSSLDSTRTTCQLKAMHMEVCQPQATTADSVQIASHNTSPT